MKFKCTVEFEFDADDTLEGINSYLEDYPAEVLEWMSDDAKFTITQAE